MDRRAVIIYVGACALIASSRANSQPSKKLPRVAVVSNSTPSNCAHIRLLTAFAASRRMPAMYAFREGLEAEGLMSFGSNIDDVFRRAAGYVAKILRGAKPGDLPIEQPTKFELVINVKVASALGLTIPPSLLLRAEQL